MQVKNIAEFPGEYSAILSTFIKLPFVFKTFVLSIFEWLLKTGFTVLLLLLIKGFRIKQNKQPITDFIISLIYLLSILEVFTPIEMSYMSIFFSDKLETHIHKAAKKGLR